jgi:hypothetical protein
MQLTNPFIVRSEILTENSAYVWDVKPSRSQHLFNVRPVLTAIEKDLEDGKVITAEERKLPVDQLMLTDMEA